jgi:hypothetical protein
MRKGRMSLNLKNPALEYATKAMPATNTFSDNEVDFIKAGAMPNNAIRARYPLAPPCPTEEYRKATANRLIRKTYSIQSPFQIQELLHREAQAFPPVPVGSHFMWFSI